MADIGFWSFWVTLQPVIILATRWTGNRLFLRVALGQRDTNKTKGGLPGIL